MVTEVTPISTPPTPSDPPAVFEERAARVWSDLHLAVPQMNLQALDIEQIGERSLQAEYRAISEADAALGYRNEAVAARNASQSAASSAASSSADAVAAKQGAEEAKGSAEEARNEAHGYALAMGQAIAMADTYTTVPTVYKSWMIVVTQPHLRVMTWDLTKNKYVRAPFHQPGKLQYFMRNVPAGYIEMRGDVVLKKSDFPDLAEYFAVTGETFVLDETRGEFLRTLDSGRGIDFGRVPGSFQGDAQRDFVAGIESIGAAGYTFISDGARVYGAARKKPYSDSGTIASNSTSSGYNRVAIEIGPGIGGLPVANENRVRSVGYRLAITY